MNTRTDAPSALIIGAGVAGLAAAWRLSRIGWRVRVLERATDLRGGGYMIGLSGPGLTAADEMGLRPALDAAAHRIEEHIYRDRSGRELMRLRFAEMLGDFPLLVFPRTALVDALYRALGPEVSVEFGADLTGVERQTDGATAHLRDGRALRADLLIGADGVRSTVRRLAFGPDHDYLRAFGYAFATYGVEDERGLEADFISYARPRAMDEYYQSGPGRVAALHVWSTGEGQSAAEERRGSDDAWAMIERHVAGSHPETRRWAEAARRQGAALTMDDMAVVKAARWSEGRVLLLGDAAHCLTLISGQGAGMAMASARLLGRALAADQPIEAALDAHDRGLRPATDRLQKRAETVAKIFIPATEFRFWARNAAMRVTPQRWIGRYFSNAVRAEALLSGAAADAGG